MRNGNRCARHRGESNPAPARFLLGGGGSLTAPGTWRCQVAERAWERRTPAERVAQGVYRTKCRIFDTPSPLSGKRFDAGIFGQPTLSYLSLATDAAVGHIDRQRRRGRVAEGGGLLNRYRLVKAYRGFESLRLRHPSHCPALRAAGHLKISTRSIPCSDVSGDESRPESGHASLQEAPWDRPHI